MKHLRRSLTALIALAVGLFLQFCFELSTTASLWGSAIIIVGTIVAAWDSKPAEYAANPGPPGRPVWKDLNAADSKRIINMLAGEQKNFVRDHVFSILRFLLICLIGAIYFYVCDNPIIGAILVDIPFSIMAFSIIRYGGTEIGENLAPNETLHPAKITAIQTIVKAAEKYSNVFEWHGQFQTTKSSTPWIRDIVIPIEYRVRVPGICAASFAVTISSSSKSADAVKYPYAYFVILVREKLDESRKLVFRNAFKDILGYTFSLDFQASHGGTSLIIRKPDVGYFNYVTSKSEIEKLVEIASKSAECIQTVCRRP
ncbi:MAG: hypothetical protein IJU23_03115 [Proteobacteria bacterium]|nr:hypothetical protein [Pseudomonadota bacterium]